MLKNKKGVSPVIAVVLMIVVAVAISLVVYVWASGFVSEKTQTETKAGDYSFLVETRDVNSTNIRNMGNDVNIGGGFQAEFDLYINDALATAADLTDTAFTDAGGDSVWNKGEVLTIDFDSDDAGTSDANATDEIKIVHKNSGTPIIFKLE
jgi:flagellin-like protein